MTTPGYKWKMVALCFSVGALNYADRAAIASVFPLVRADLQLSDVELAGVGSFFLLTYALASPLAGVLADRVSRSRMILWSLVGWSMVTLLTGLVTTTPQLLFTRALLGLFEAAYLPAAVGLIADYHGTHTRATALGIHAAGLSIGVVAGGTAFGYLGEHLGWRDGFLVLGAIGVALAMVTRLGLHDAPVSAKEAAALKAKGPPLLENLLLLARIPSYVLILAASMCIGVGNWIFLNWLPLYFKETYHMSLAGAGFAGTFMFQGAGIVAGLLGSFFSDRIAGDAPARRMLIQGVTGFVAAPFLLVFFWPTPALIVINCCIFLFSFTLTFGVCNGSPLTCDLLPARLRSTAVGLGNSLNCLAGGAGVMLSGFLKASIGLKGVFGGISGMILVSASCMLVGYVWFVRRDLATANRLALSEASR